MECFYYRQLSFNQARQMQIQAVEDLQSGTGQEQLIFCQHPPTITLGKRVPLNDVSEQLTDWRERGIEVIQTDRGGEMTYHGPGQLVVYPVIDLRRYGLGVRNFVELVLGVIANELDLPGVELDCKQVGLWTSPGRKKISSVGLHLGCDIEIFDEFPVCGMDDAKVTSLHLERGVHDISVKRFSTSLAKSLRDAFEERRVAAPKVANLT